jgi:hypothetical protein
MIKDKEASMTLVEARDLIIEAIGQIVSKSVEEMTDDEVAEVVNDVVDLTQLTTKIDTLIGEC